MTQRMPMLRMSHSHAKVHTHIHTHTHIYIYIYIVVLGKLHIETKNHIAPSVKTLKGAIVGQNWEGNLHFYNNSDIQNIFDLNPKPSVLSPQLPKDLVQEWSRNYETDNKSGGNGMYIYRSRNSEICCKWRISAEDSRH